MELFCIIFLAVLIPLLIVFNPAALWKYAKYVLLCGVICGAFVGVVLLVEDSDIRARATPVLMIGPDGKSYEVPRYNVERAEREGGFRRAPVVSSR